ncbi:hypothetical protein [Paraglaciecola sp.]|uniref:hypothetical protein n=1 Tax=Paraglaciecola sp. TaxID=1920173 RepID=UPI003EF95EC4
MNTKFLRVLFAAVLSMCFVGQSNATVIYTDSAGVEWDYVGSFNLADGPSFDDADGSCDLPGANQQTCWGDYAKPLNGIQAAELLFSTGHGEIFATSTVNNSVNHLAFYDEFGFNGQVAVEKSESIVADLNGDGKYDNDGDSSAYIKDRAASDVVNYVFKRVVDVPSPSTLAIFVLAICGLTVRRIKA